VNESQSPPDYFEAFTGWRTWYLDNDELYSVVYRVRWPRRQPLVAECRKGSMQTVAPTTVFHDAPLRGCQCGIYAAATVPAVGGYMVSHGPTGVPRAIGRVKLWGRIIVGTTGYRATRAYPEELWVLRNGVYSSAAYSAWAPGRPGHWHTERAEELAEKLEERYGVPVGVIEGGMPADVTKQLLANGGDGG